MINEQQKNFLEIVKCAVHEQPLNLPESVSYGEILSLAREQNLLALVCEKLCKRESFLASREYGKAAAYTIGIVAGQSRRTSVFLNLYRAFEDAGLQPIVMKGIVCRELYGKFRNHRPSGDADLLILPEDFSLLEKVMEAQGFRIEREDITDRELEAVQEITFYHQESRLAIEVHTNPMGKESGIRRQMNRYFKEVFPKKEPVEIQGTQIWTMDPTDHFLFLVLHAFKHLMSGGLGIRQTLDICLFYEKYGARIRREYIWKSLKETDAAGFFADLLYIGGTYLGFDLSEERKANCPEALLEDMLDNGIFGNTTQAERTAASMTAAAVDNREKYSKALAVCRAIFPKKEFMISRNPELIERPWLLPVCWVKRWGRFLLYNKKKGGGLAEESIRISQRRIDLLKKYGVIGKK